MEYAARNVEHSKMGADSSGEAHSERERERDDNHHYFVHSW
jgi:hypothetical protein